MKTGRVAKLFARDPKTITAWTDQFKEFFSKEALGEGGQREYSQDDLIILNTIRAMKAERKPDDSIVEALKQKDYNLALPPEFASIEGEQAIAVYAQMAALQAQNTLLMEKDAQKDKVIADLHGQIADLNQQIGKWKALYEMASKQD